MTKFEIKYPPGATPLDPDEREGLIPDYITTHGELNDLEQRNIQDAIVWAQRHPAETLTPSFLYALHKQMFDQVWKWAGKMRRSEKNIGIDPQQISPQIAQLLANSRHWIDNRTFPADEIGVRFHHRLVHIHVFPNGNGRHARLMTDLLLEELGQSSFSWGRNSNPSPIETEGPRRAEYIAALQAADKNNYNSLLVFARS